jgi:hypothetical protein
VLHALAAAGARDAEDVASVNRLRLLRVSRFICQDGLQERLVGAVTLNKAIDVALQCLLGGIARKPPTLAALLVPSSSPLTRAQTSLCTLAQHFTTAEAS